MTRKTGPMHSNPPRIPTAEEETRNRMSAHALLALRHQTLMAVLKNVPRDFHERLDYGNASAWLRGVPGRFGIKKQRALLYLIGYADGALRTDMVHVWYPPRRHVPPPAKGAEPIAQEDENVQSFFAHLVACGSRFQRRRVTTPEGAPLGWALNVMGATVLLPIHNGNSESDITSWFKRQGLDKTSLRDEIVIAKETWLDCLGGNGADHDFWADRTDNTVSPQWLEVIQAAQSRGLQPDILLDYIRQYREEQILSR